MVFFLLGDTFWDSSKWYLLIWGDNTCTDMQVTFVNYDAYLLFVPQISGMSLLFFSFLSLTYHQISLDILHGFHTCSFIHCSYFLLLCQSARLKGTGGELSVSQCFVITCVHITYVTTFVLNLCSTLSVLPTRHTRQFPDFEIVIFF